MKTKSFFICVNSLLVLLLCIFSCTRKEIQYLDKAIRQDTEIFPLIYTPDSVIILVGMNSRSIIDELRNHMYKKNPEEFLYESIEYNMPVCVTKEFYEKAQRCLIYPNPTITSFYLKRGVPGLVSTYLKYDSLKNFYIKQSFSGKDSLGEYTINQELEYIAYLFSQFDIYFRKSELNHNGVFPLSVEIESSDEKVLRRFSNYMR